MSGGIGDGRITIERHLQSPRPERFTMALDDEAAALLRVAAAEWGMTQGWVVGLALRWLHATGAAAAAQVTISADGQARIAAAVERAAVVGVQARPDPRLYRIGGAADGNDAAGTDGGGRSESAINPRGGRSG